MNSGESPRTADPASTGKLPLLEVVVLSRQCATMVLSNGRSIKIPEPDAARVVQLWQCIGMRVEVPPAVPVEKPDEYGQGPTRCERCEG